MQCLGKLTYWAYAKSKLESTKSINIKDYTEIAANQDYIRKIFGIKYKLNTDNMIRQKANIKLR